MAFLLLSLWFQAGWFLAVAGRESYLLITCLWVGASYLWQWHKARQRLREMGLLAMLGLVVDQSNIAIGIMDFEQAWLPVWMVCLWLLFAWYASHFVDAFTRWPSYWLCLLVAVSATFSYYAGSALGAVILASPFSALVLFLQWLIIAKFMLHLRARRKA